MTLTGYGFSLKKISPSDKFQYSRIFDRRSPFTLPTDPDPHPQDPDPHPQDPDPHPQDPALFLAQDPHPINRKADPKPCFLVLNTNIRETGPGEGNTTTL